MHETMLKRHVELLAYCYDVFEQKISADTVCLADLVSDTSESSRSQFSLQEKKLRRRYPPVDNLPERPIPGALSKVAK
jgi:hypothetical protein